MIVSSLIFLLEYHRSPVFFTASVSHPVH